MRTEAKVLDARLETLAFGNTPKEISRVLVNAYPRATGVTAALIRLRAYNCPLHELLKAMPAGGSFIDVGCGIGIMSVLLAHVRAATKVIGVDTSARAIEIARAAVLPARTEHSFRHVSIENAWPSDEVTGVVCLDVLHHVPKDQQREFIRRMAGLNFSGKIYFKDVSPKPFWKSLGSHLHDLLIRGERIHLRHEDEVRQWFEEEGLVVAGPVRLDNLWYTHYFMTAERPTPDAVAGH